MAWPNGVPLLLVGSNLVGYKNTKVRYGKRQVPLPVSIRLYHQLICYRPPNSDVPSDMNTGEEL